MLESVLQPELAVGASAAAPRGPVAVRLLGATPPVGGVAGWVKPCVVEYSGPDRGLARMRGGAGRNSMHGYVQWRRGATDRRSWQKVGWMQWRVHEDHGGCACGLRAGTGDGDIYEQDCAELMGGIGGDARGRNRTLSAESDAYSELLGRELDSGSSSIDRGTSFVVGPVPGYAMLSLEGK
eukprot:SAG11_NODE_5654_length_1494_cov_1.362007_1_plen_181_part_00